ncbi:MAG: cob(I)yrinic acid a,c-diamide adenosyltransferase [Muribaculaceae bacterium]|nr:cob(I)yrinic acid a,c-diamide adenosyltransferase [Muribaculaceae bacterium]
MKKSNLYTRTGDLGTTSLVDGSRVSKSHPRLNAYGTVDELNAAIALLTSDPATLPEWRSTLTYIQHKLFTIGAYLATPVAEPGAITTAIGLGQKAISRLEQDIDALDATLPPLRQFVIPGGTPSSAAAHMARTICRRAEREIVSLTETGVYVDPDVRRFINRISDYLFALSRAYNHSAGAEEIFWDKDC